MLRLRRSALLTIALPAAALLTTAACGPERATVTEVERRDGILVRIGSGEPFTGLVDEPFADTAIGVAEGVVARVTPYVEGRLEGERVSFHPNGRVRRRQPFVRDTTQGTQREWTEEGVLLLEQAIVDGRPHGRRAPGTPMVLCRAKRPT
jgi:hypothetical protein